MSDDLYPNAGEYFDPSKEPDEQRVDRNQEKAEVQEGLPLLEKLITRMDERIGFYKSIDSLGVDVETHPEEHLRATIAAARTKDNLIAERDYMIGLREQYRK